MSVPKTIALGTVFSGFCTSPAEIAPASIPENAQSVSSTVVARASNTGSSLGLKSGKLSVEPEANANDND